MAALRRAIMADPASVPSPIASAAYAFVDNEAYFTQTYGTTLRALRTLEQAVGPTRFAAAMKAYARAWAFRHPTGRDLFDTLTRELGEDLDWFFGPVFQQVGGMKLAVRTASCERAHEPRGVFGAGPGRKTVTATEAPDSGGYACEVVVTNTGAWHVRLEIELRFEDGFSQRVEWDAREGGHWKRFAFKRSSKLTEVILDPDGKVELDSPMTHHYRLGGDGAAALRGGAWFASTAQTLMQLVGL